MYLCKIDSLLTMIVGHIYSTTSPLSIIRPSFRYLDHIYVKLIGLDIISS